MWLLNVNSLELEEFFGENTPPYAILSHTWQQGEEVTFVDLALPDKAQHKAGWKKILYTCQQAKQEELGFAWVDTCCIDKRSSAELSEAINSMFAWYSNAQVCYVYMNDVTVLNFHATFLYSRWFTRGWTLQELLAPKRVLFFDRDWKSAGYKADDLAPTISSITKIAIEVLRDPDLIQKQSVACRMSWASCRNTTRLEDIAYSLMGIFDVHMPLLYGEGDRAFGRLQDEILKAEVDHSIFAWGLRPYKLDSSGNLERRLESGLTHLTDHCLNLLAGSPQAFKNSGDIVKGYSSQFKTFTMTNKELHIILPIVSSGLGSLGLLDCHLKGPRTFLVAIPLIKLELEAGYMRQGVTKDWSSKIVPFEIVVQASIESTLIKRHRYNVGVTAYIRIFYQDHIVIATTKALKLVLRGPHILLPLQGNDSCEQQVFQLPRMGSSKDCVLLRFCRVGMINKLINVLLEPWGESNCKVRVLETDESRLRYEPDHGDHQWNILVDEMQNKTKCDILYAGGAGVFQLLSHSLGEKFLFISLENREIYRNLFRELKFDIK